LSITDCRAWKGCLHWAKLETLDLGYLLPFVFFSEFSGCTPNLKSLSFLFNAGETGAEIEDNLQTIGVFLGGIKRLEHLEIKIRFGYFL
jgi:hypothetical protein